MVTGRVIRPRDGGAVWASASSASGGRSGTTYSCILLVVYFATVALGLLVLRAVISAHMMAGLMPFVTFANRNARGAQVFLNHPPKASRLRNLRDCPAPQPSQYSR